MKNPNRVKKVKRIKRIRKWKKRSLVMLGVFSFLICFFIAFVYTSLGIKTITAVLSKVMPEIQIEQVDGALNDLHVKGFSLTLPGLDVNVGQASLSISGLCLLEGKLCVKNLDTSDITVTIDTTTLSGESDKQETQPVDAANEPFVLSTPIPIELRNANLANINVHVDDMLFALSSFKGKAIWVNNEIYLPPTEIIGVKAIFPDTPKTETVSAKIDESESVSINTTINQIFNKPLIATLPEVNIPLDFYVRGLTGKDWLLHIGGEDFIFDNITIDARTSNNHIQVDKVETETKNIYADAHLLVSGNIILGNNWPVSAMINAESQPSSGQFSADQNSDLTTQVTRISSRISGNLLGTLTTYTIINGFNDVTIDGKINFIEHYMPVTAKLTGKHIQWPIIGQAEYQLNDFLLDLSGSVKQYTLTSYGQVQGQSLPDIQFDISAEGTNEGMLLEHATVNVPQGKANVSGKVDWVDALSWNVGLIIDHIDLTKDFVDYPIKLNGQLQTSGLVSEQDWLVNLEQLDIKGEVNHAPLSATGKLVVDSGKQVAAEQFKLSWGENLIYLNGSAENEDLQAKIDLSALDLIEPNLKGNINGLLNIKGQITNPIIDADLLVEHFAWQNIQLDNASLKGHVAYQHQASGEMEIQLSSLQLPGLLVTDAHVKLSGSEQQHRLDVTLNGNPVSVSTTLTGALNSQRTNWQGALSDSAFTFDERYQWQLAQTLPLSYNITQQIATINQHCWVNGESSLCLDNQLIASSSGNAHISLNNISLTELPLPNDGETRLAGYFDGKVNVGWNEKNTIPEITVAIDSNEVFIEQMIGSQSLPIPFDRFLINANINQQRASLDWIFSLERFGSIKGQVIISEPTTRKNLSGYFITDHLSLALINPLLQGEDHAKGVINSNLKFSGALDDPYIKGTIDLEQSEIKSSQLPADIESISLDVDFYGKSSTLKGILTTHAGEVIVDGKANWENINNWHAEVTVNGADIEVVVPPMVTLTVRPDLRIEANQEQLNLSGKIVIPKGRIVVESLPASSVDVSRDEVMLNEHLEEIAEQQFAMRVNSNLHIIIEDRVTVSAFGLNANLKGNLLLRQDHQGLGVNGQILIPHGRFRAYGQDLIINQGELIFAGPVDQPQLNIEAVRNSESIEDNVTAGIRVTGRADEPIVEVFSQPAMSQQEALSYLLRGQGLNAGEQSDDDMMTSLLIGLATAQGGKYIGDIGNIFGIKNLSLDTQGVGDDSKVVVSGYLSPSLQLKYGVGIFDSLAVFTLRYRILPRLFLEASSGIDQTVDLLYQFEF